ncbi:MAG: hypothetical protein JNL70_05935 [Saprospiraceae bacterium]|nr:hypothetical protein [Saprospiraceae bacterium]
MRSIIFSLVLSLGCAYGKAQSVGLSVEQIKLPPQYSALKKKGKTILTQQNSGTSQNMSEKPQKVPSVFSVETLPFFCKIEYKIGLNKKLPLKFRLGDVQYVDELEGKSKILK